MFKPVKGYEGFYEISDYGILRTTEKITKIKSCNQYGRDYNMFERKSKSVIMKPRIINNYLRIFLFKDGKYKTHPIHRLVAEAFCEKPELAQCVNHKNANKLDNRAENLEWVTFKENAQHALNLGLCDKRIENSKIKVVMYEEKGKIIAIKDSSRDMAEYLSKVMGVSSKIETMARTIRKVCKCYEIGLDNIPKKRGKRQMFAYGYKFCYLKDYSD